MNPNIERGSTFKFRQGFPEVRISAIGFLDEGDDPGIDVTADIVYGSLIYKENQDSLQARFTIEIQVLPKDNTSGSPTTHQETITITRSNSNIVNSQDLYSYDKRIPVDPGTYDINVTVIDRNSGKQLTRQTQTFIPDPGNSVQNLTNIQLLGKKAAGDWAPITTYDVQRDVDSLMFRLQVTNNTSEEPLAINARLMRFESDTTIARPMYFNGYSPSSIQYKGIDYDEEEVLQSTRRILTQPGSVLIEYKFGSQPRGNYRFDVQNDEDEENRLFKARDFGVKSKNYPSIKSARELASPLYYLMSKKEYEELMAIQDKDSLKQAVDRFWLKNLNNKNRARQVIQMYYQRVEEANKQFSNFKEGWKTDLGMIYILFGPPWYVDQSLNRMRWSYSYNRDDPEYNYLFETPKLQSEFYPYQNYLLQRNQYYFNVEYQQTQLWLTGQILRRSL
ncbi:GWxTD domain-containing protein [Balneolaceae bacterium YR4-1]|uniref:GWxTD domain-containing protein n=2 Tax=Halalkalibaculum roseum TaxID=2709311 RepID=A0A6M1SYI1_9BACT|nr:GWxTD domain-containing protein [Halalkalibaculum roseum]